MPSNRELRAHRRELRNNGVAEGDELLNAINVVLDRRNIESQAGRTPKGSPPKPLIECGIRTALDRQEAFARTRKFGKRRLSWSEREAKLRTQRHKSTKAFYKWLRATER